MAESYFTVEHIPRKDLCRIFSKISVSIDIQWNGTPCWIWTAFLNDGGYGTVSWLGYQQLIHRLTYAWTIGPVPKRQRGKPLPDEIDHLCRNRACCNPIHLELVPPSVNKKRGLSVFSGSTDYCIRGHAFTVDNTYRTGPLGMNRACVICASERKRQHAAMIKADPVRKAKEFARLKTHRQTTKFKTNKSLYMKARRKAGLDTVYNREKERLATDPLYRAKYNARKQKERRKRKLRLMQPDLPA